MKTNKLMMVLALVVLIAIIFIIALFSALSVKNNRIGSTNPNKTNSSASPVNPAPIGEMQAKNTFEEARPVARLDVMPMTPDAPQQKLVAIDQIPDEAIKLSVSDKGFSPASFTAKANTKVTLAITSTDDKAHVFLFPNASLMALTTMVLGRETKTISFETPGVGIYSFRDDIPDLRQNVGTMVIE